MSYSTPRNNDWEFIVTKFLFRCDAWVGRTISMAGRTILLNVALTIIVYYHMSMFLLNKTTTEKLDKIRRKIFWQGSSLRKIYHLVKWSRICRSKKKGGLGVKDLRKQNISLLTKWWWKLETKQGLWQDVIRAKYFKKDTVTLVKTRFNYSPIWKAIMKAKTVILLQKSSVEIW